MRSSLCVCACARVTGVFTDALPRGGNGTAGRSVGRLDAGAFPANGRLASLHWRRSRIMAPEGKEKHPSAAPTRALYARGLPPTPPTNQTNRTRGGRRHIAPCHWRNRPTRPAVRAGQPALDAGGGQMGALEVDHAAADRWLVTHGRLWDTARRLVLMLMTARLHEAAEQTKQVRHRA